MIQWKFDKNYSNVNEHLDILEYKKNIFNSSNNNFGLEEQLLKSRLDELESEEIFEINPFTFSPAMFVNKLCSVQPMTTLVGLAYTKSII